ncbi:DNA polymerase III subunit gamma/tau [Collinsella tanakaei]|uniref:DNA polymerase III subunit gamma/tau n=1 Tax=Collinsella tanakaei TaxID=626935 RepID=UPI00294391AC|nr:DNA polymerase III subunit gamma/tau [Collinsella tanakaei]
MESLYRKYRPLTFESVVGQQHIVSTLQHAVTEGRLSHAYLFCGPRGTGKTTMARILAKALLCQKAHGDHGCMPDGTCPECEAIAEGAHPDVYELDAASRTGVDSVREEIINSVNFAPVRGTYKVYIIDEVHMLTTQAFNALLKTLEEPPSHVVFVLCTTDPQKLLDTILSRCQRFDFHRISNEDILARMRYVCEQEGFSYDEEALEIVAKHARGGMRDALSTLEQLSVFGGGSVRLADARSLLGEVSSTILAQFARGIASRDVVELFGLVRTQVDEGNDLMELTRDLVGHVRDVYTAFVAGAKPELLDCTPEEATALKEEASHFENADRLARVLTVLDDAALEMRNASDMRLVLEIALTRLARPESDLTLEALAERLDRLEARIASGVPSAPMDAAALAALGGAVASASSTGASRPAASAPATSAAAPVGASAIAPAAAPSRPAPQPAASSPGDLPWMKNAQRPAASAASAAAPVQSQPAAPKAAPAPAPTPVRPQQPTQSKQPAAAPAPRTAAAPVSAPTPVAPQPAPAPASAPAASPSAPVTDAGELQRKWSDVVKRVVAAHPSHGALLQSAHAASDDGSKLVVELPAGSGFAMKMLARKDSRSVIIPVAVQVFGQREVEFTMAGAPAPAPAAPASAPAPAAAPASSPAPVSQQSAPAPAPVPVAASSPAPSFVPKPQADMPATTSPAAVAPAAAPQADHTSGPTVVAERDIEADRKAWEDEQVPYDDAAIAAYEGDADVPPMDLPADAPADAPAPAPTTVAPAAPNPALSASAPAAPSAPAAASGALPWATHPGAEDQIPKNEEEAKSMLGDIFGPGIVFKPGE